MLLKLYNLIRRFLYAVGIIALLFACLAIFQAVMYTFGGVQVSGEITKVEW